MELLAGRCGAELLPRLEVLVDDADHPVAQILQRRKLHRVDRRQAFPEPVFLDWVRDLGLNPPPIEQIKPKYSDKIFSLRDWDDWWEKNAPQMTNEQRAQIWKALDRLTFYEIVQTGIEE